MAHSPEAGSSSSTIGLSSIVINKNKLHPEQWTMPGQWNIEKRETYVVSTQPGVISVELNSYMYLPPLYKLTTCVTITWVY